MKSRTPNASYDWTPDSYIITVTPSIIDRFHFPFVQEMGELKTNSTYYTKREKLPSYLLVYTVGGKGYLTYENRQYTLRQGDIFLIDCMKFQHYYTDERELWHLRFVHFFGGISEKYYKIFVSETRNALHLPPTSRIPVYLDHILQIYQPSTPNSDLLAAMYIVQMLTEVILNVRSCAKTGRQDYAKEIAWYIDEHYSEDLTLETLARQFSLEKSYLPKKFKSQFGITPTAYLAAVRIRKAKELLHATDYPVCKIAELVGMANTSYFIRLFKAQEALTPHEYRQKWKNNYERPDIRRYPAESQKEQ